MANAKNIITLKKTFTTVSMLRRFAGLYFKCHYCRAPLEAGAFNQCAQGHLLCATCRCSRFYGKQNRWLNLVSCRNLTGSNLLEMLEDETVTPERLARELLLCPVCHTVWPETDKPEWYRMCQNGHVVCFRCAFRTKLLRRCPVCRKSDFKYQRMNDKVANALCMFLKDQLRNEKEWLGQNLFHGKM